MEKNNVDNTEELRTVSFFTGYGGVERGLGMAGERITHVASCEIEAYAQANLIAKMETGQLPPHPIWTDAKTFPAREFRGRVDLFTGGFPCQPFSSAGSRNADEDPRHLFPACLQFIEGAVPTRVFLENVEGLISANLGGDGWSDPKGTPVLLHVLRELERRGYRTTWGLFSAAEVGAPHQRKRVFILGELANPNRDDAGRNLRELQEEKRTKWVQEWYDHTQPISACEINRAELGNSKHDGSSTTEKRRSLDTPSNHDTQGTNKPGQPEGTSGSGSLCSISGEELADTDGTRLQGLTRDSLNRCQRLQPGNKFNAPSGIHGGGVATWPNRPGQPQHEWEEPRVTTKSKLGGTTDGTSFRVDRLRLLGNGVVPYTAEKAWRLLNFDLWLQEYTEALEKSIKKEIY